MTRTQSSLLAMAFVVGGCLAALEAAGQGATLLLSNPTVGGPYGIRPTHLCSDLGDSYCYSTRAGSPVSAASAALPYMDNAARNWGCQWNLGANAAAPLGGGNWSKWYGTETDNVRGCGLVYWNYAKQAAYFLPSADRGGDVAAASQGATVIASSTYNGGTPASSLLDGNRKGNVWGSGGGWSSLYNPTPTAPQWIQINLNGSRTIHEIVVTTLQDNYSSPIEPTTATTFATYGIRNYSVQYWNGSSWVVLGSAVANNKVLRRFTFPAVTTAYIRVHITGALQNYARVVEVEAYDTSPSSAKLLDRYASLRYHAGILGYPVSNPTPYGWSGATYQQFTSGLITYVSGRAGAFHVGGIAPEDKALAAKYARQFGIDPSSGPAIYGLAQEVGCTSAFGTGCGSGATGRYLEWWDTYQGFAEMIIARTGWTTAVRVPGPIRSEWMQQYGRIGPWNGALGFPVTDLLPTGSATYHQEFETGTIVWERTGCSSGTYAARIVSQFRRPIFASNLSMLCEGASPVNAQLSLPSAPVRFDIGGKAGAYTFNSGRDDSGWFQGARIAFDGGPTLDVTGAFYSAWIGGADGGGNVADALAMAPSASTWGEPTSNATCLDNPCTMQVQSFANGVASLPLGGVVGFAPDAPGLSVPTSLGPVERGYTTPPVPADRRTPIPHRSGDYITLVWRNRSTAPGVTTRLFRSVTPLNGSPSGWTLIHTYPPPTLANGTFTFYKDEGATNNARNCYYLNVSDGFSSNSTSMSCAYTLDGTVASEDRSAPRGVSRAQIRIEVPPSPYDSGTTKAVGVRLDSFAGGFDYNFTYVDSTAQDFTLNSIRDYDLRLTGIEDVADITGITLTSYRDNLRVSYLELRLNNVAVFSKVYDPPVLVSNSDLPGGRSLVVGFDELRSHTQEPVWDNVYRTPTLAFIGFTPADFKAKLDGILGHEVMSTPGAAYHGSRLRDGYTSSVTKRPGYLGDRLHVNQHITADASQPAFCTLEYDLRITAKDIDGNSVSSFFNGPSPGIIYTTEIRLENPDVSCSSSFWKNIVDTFLRASPFVSELSNLERDLEAGLRGLAPSTIQSAPPPDRHFCFPGATERVPSPLFRNGGLTVCEDE